MTKILVFGIFDGIHPGHIDFLRQAKEYGDFLIVAVGQSSAARELKSKEPKHSLEKRLKFIQEVEYVNRAVPGDSEQGTYETIKQENPDVVCLGYDQKELAQDLTKWLTDNETDVRLEILKPYEPEKYHTSILKK